MSEQHKGQPSKSVADSSASQTRVVIVHFLARVAQQQESHNLDRAVNLLRELQHLLCPTVPAAGSVVK